MANTLYEGASGVQVDTYAAPESAAPPRTRVQLGVIDENSQGWRTLHLTLDQWADLVTACAEIGDIRR